MIGACICAQQEFDKDHKLCSVVKRLNLDHQNSAGIKLTLPKVWATMCGHLVEKVEGQLSDDGTVNFYYDTKLNLNFYFKSFKNIRKTHKHDIILLVKS